MEANSNKDCSPTGLEMHSHNKILWLKSSHRYVDSRATNGVAVVWTILQYRQSYQIEH